MVFPLSHQVSVVPAASLFVAEELFSPAPQKNTQHKENKNNTWYRYQLFSTGSTHNWNLQLLIRLFDGLFCHKTKVLPVRNPFLTPPPPTKKNTENLKYGKEPTKKD